jgi:hypothetical protein
MIYIIPLYHHGFTFPTVEEYADVQQWLTTGRNSCPLCRGQGVEEKHTAAKPDDDLDRELDPGVA